MAIIKAISSRSPTGRTIDYIKNDKKTKGLVSGINCSPNTAKEEFEITKKMYGKTGGRKHKHFEISHPPGESITPLQAHLFAEEFIKSNKIFDGFEILIGTHQDTNHIHSHFIVNSVSMEDGHKFQQSFKDLHSLKEQLTQMCIDNRLRYEIDGVKSSEISVATTKEYKQIMKGFDEQGNYMRGKSYKLDMVVDIRDCKRDALDKMHFIKLMKGKGYTVNWSDTRKNIVYIDHQGNKVKDVKLEKSFHTIKCTKEALEDEFTNNRAERVRGENTEFQSKIEGKSATEPSRVRKHSTTERIGRIDGALREVNHTIAGYTATGEREQPDRAGELAEGHRRNSQQREADRKPESASRTNHNVRNAGLER